MSRRDPSVEGRREPAATNAVAVISAYGAFRVLLVLLAVWSFFEGFALFTAQLPGLSFGDGDRTAQRVVGAQMIVFTPVYGLLAWQRERHRLLVWVPYGAQLAIILPTLWAVLTGNPHSLLLLIISTVFLVLLFYFWWHSHPLDFYLDDDEQEDVTDGEEEEGEALPPDGARATGGPSRQAAPPPRPRGRFRRRG